MCIFHKPLFSNLILGSVFNHYGEAHFSPAIRVGTSEADDAREIEADLNDLLEFANNCCVWQLTTNTC